jgi:hypothetical protein
LLKIFLNGEMHVGSHRAALELMTGSTAQASVGATTMQFLILEGDC